jgi:hypothetical protein
MTGYRTLESCHLIVGDRHNPLSGRQRNRAAAHPSRQEKRANLSIQGVEIEMRAQDAVADL